MIFAYYFFAALLIYFSYRSYRGGIEYLRYFRDAVSKPPSSFTPFATVIMPLRGVDDGLSENLSAVFRQEYPQFEIIFAVDDESDPAIAVIEKTRKPSRVNLKIVLAGKADGCSQKVENLREAVLHVDDRSEIFVFVDSDARPSLDWISRLVEPLEEHVVGATTGYRWFISAEPTIASELRSVWNASIASSLGSNTSSNFCWGGSMAIRRDVFKKHEIRDRWKGTLSDDFTVTRTLNQAGMPVVFVPQALVASVENGTFRQMLEFTTRQMKITRVYSPNLWLLSMFGSALFNGVMIVSIIIIVISTTNDRTVMIAAATLALVSALSVGKAHLRLRAVRLILTEWERELTRQRFSQMTLWFVTPTVFLFNCVSAAFSKRLTWRQIRYELKSPNETVIIAD